MFLSLSNIGEFATSVRNLVCGGLPFFGRMRMNTRETYGRKMVGEVD
jgi:hypothetical protein